MTETANAGLKQSGRLKRYTTIVVKILFTAGALYLVLTKADLREIGNYLQNMNIAYAFLGLILLNCGQVISALRMRYYFAPEKIFSRPYSAIAFYYVGMFFNRLLPGGVGGDGYIAYLLKKKHQVRLRTSIRLLISSRANGLLQLMIFAFILGFLSQMSGEMAGWNSLMTIGLLLTIISYSFLTRLILREKISTQIGALRYSVFVQGAVMAAAASLFVGAGQVDQLADYLMLFMVSSIMTMIPISFGGAGMRELTYFYGAGLIGLDPELGIAISVVYFLLDVISSLAGLFFWYRVDRIPVFKPDV